MVKDNEIAILAQLLCQVDFSVCRMVKDRELVLFIKAELRKAVLKLNDEEKKRAKEAKGDKKKAEKEEEDEEEDDSEEDSEEEGAVVTKKSRKGSTGALSSNGYEMMDEEPEARGAKRKAVESKGKGKKKEEAAPRKSGTPFHMKMAKLVKDELKRVAENTRKLDGDVKEAATTVYGMEWKKIVKYCYLQGDNQGKDECVLIMGLQGGDEATKARDLLVWELTPLYREKEAQISLKVNYERKEGGRLRQKAYQIAQKYGAAQ